MDLEKMAKIRRERELEPSNDIGSKFLAGEPPMSMRPEDDIAKTEDSSVGSDGLEKIRNRAYSIWLNEGQPHGRDEEHWKQAELQINAEGKGP